MSSTTLADRFAQSLGQPQEVDGMIVQNMFRRDIVDGQVVHVRRRRASGRLVQGLRLKVEKGTVRVNGQEVKDAVLWADSAPDEVELICHTGKRSNCELRVWNCWRDEGGIMQAWIGNAGIVVRETGDAVEILCSDGTHQFDPSDLEVELRFTLPSK
jgi:hypothetical protein